MRTALTMLTFTIMLLTAALPAAAEVEGPFDIDMTPSVEPWPADTPLLDYSNSSWNFVLTMPSGGVMKTEAEAGIEPGSDPMSYPLIWVQETSPLAFDMIMLGIYPNGSEMDEAGFTSLNTEENTNYMKSYPSRVNDDSDVMLSDLIWRITNVQSADGQQVVTKASTYSGAYYYSLAFVYGPDDDVDVVWSQVASIVSSMGPLAEGTTSLTTPLDTSYSGDEYYDEYYDDEDW